MALQGAAVCSCLHTGYAGRFRNWRGTEEFDCLADVDFDRIGRSRRHDAVYRFATLLAALCWQMNFGGIYLAGLR